MTDKQYGDFQRYIGIVQGFAEGLGENGILLRNTAIKLASLVDELYNVKVDDDRPHSYL